jgi:prepilin-type N-terminal cleavage/methylation domain-containing protein
MKREAGIKGRCSGFTMIEVMVACIIIAILGTITIAGFTAWLPNYRLKSAVRDLYATMQQVKLAAIKQQGNCTITYSTTPSHQYAVTGVTKTVVLSDYGSGVRFLGPSSETFSPAIITFNSRGMCSGTVGYAYLSNQSQTDFFRVGPMSTGAVKLEKWNAGTWQ